MDRKKLILIIGVVVLMGLVFVLGFGYGYQWGAREEVEVREPPRILELETSAVITRQHAIAKGEIIEILNQTLTLAANEDVLTIPIIEKVKVSVPVSFKIVAVAEKTVGVERRKIEKPDEMEFGDLKVGDKVEVLIEIKPDGDFIGRHITILSE